MRSVGFVLTLATLALLAQSSYHVTHTRAGRRRDWDYVVPIRRITAFSSRGRIASWSLMERRKLLGEVTGINGAHGTAIAEKSGHGCHCGTTKPLSCST
jgi:hypothetical protein